MLGLGNDEGMAILGDARAGDTRPLAEALARARAERDAPPTRTETLEHDAERASSAMRKVREVLERFTEIAEGRIDAGILGEWADELLDRLKGLDPDEHWQERLRVLRTLVVLLVLLGRWLELARSLSDAVQAAKRLGDKGARAWALHELGTLHLAAEQNAEADDDLGEALRLRMRPGGGEGARVTEANLGELCKRLRSQLHHAAFTNPRPSVSPAEDKPTPSPLGWLVHKPVLLLVLGLAVLIAGGVTGAAIAGESSVNPHPLAIVIEAVPASPQIGEPIAFRTKVESRADPGHYSWLFGDGEGTNSANPTHVYVQAGRYTVTVAVSGAHDTAAGEATRMVIVRPSSSSPEAGPPTAGFSFTPSPALVGHAVRFNASDSSDPDTHATISNYLWNFGDGHTQTGADPTHVYAEPGAHTVELVVADTRGASGRTTRTIRVEEQTSNSARPAFTSVTSAMFAAGTSARFPVTATGKPTPTIGESGTLPNGVSFLNSALTGTPTTTGTFPLTFTATNSAGKATQAFTLKVVASGTTVEPQITSSTSTVFTQGSERSFSVTASGTPTPTIGESGTLPNGVSFLNSALTGTPTSTGTFPLTFTATNSAGKATQDFTLTVESQSPPESKPSFTSFDAASFVYGRRERFQVTATGEPPPKITVEGKPPKGVRFEEEALVGTAEEGGTFSLTFIASNKAGSAVQAFTLKVIEEEAP
ncbi:MAG TPA: PKD domain-containing protein [Solirubrobacteraceae bacterium]|nr:PKD domain-containing protein [Solirubrobacteraceae bacterium]